METLVALLVFSIGLAGIINAQLSSLTAHKDSSIMRLAVQLTGNMIESVLANKAAITLGEFDLKTTAPAVDCTSTTCSPSELADEAFNHWQTQLALGLPQSLGIICRDTTMTDGTPINPACDGVGGLVAKVWWVDTAGDLQAHVRGIVGG